MYAVSYAQTRRTPPPTSGVRGIIEGMTLTVEEAKQLPIVTDTEVEQRVSGLVGVACRRQLWLLFIDADAVQLSTVVVIEDYPAGPAGGSAALVAFRIGEVIRETDAAQVVIVWERRLGEQPVPADRAWAKALAEACAAEGVPVRAQLISHRRGVRWFPPADYA
jgi:hypothetical protein